MNTGVSQSISLTHSCTFALFSVLYKYVSQVKTLILSLSLKILATVREIFLNKLYV